MTFPTSLKNGIELLRGFICNLRSVMPSRDVILIVISTAFSGAGIFAYQQYEKSREALEVNVDDKLALSLVERDKDLRINEIKETPSWLRDAVVSRYTEDIHTEVSRRDNSFTRKLRDFLVMKFVDLNRDEIPEVMINYSGITLCGNKDCPTDIYEIVLHERKLRKIGTVTPWAYKILDIHDVTYFDYDGYRLIVNCIYGDGDVGLLVYSLQEKKYEEKRVREEFEYGGSPGCNFFDSERLNLTQDMVDRTIRLPHQE